MEQVRSTSWAGAMRGQGPSLFSSTTWCFSFFASVVSFPSRFPLLRPFLPPSQSSPALPAQPPFRTGMLAPISCCFAQLPSALLQLLSLLCQPLAAASHHEDTNQAPLVSRKAQRKKQRKRTGMPMSQKSTSLAHNEWAQTLLWQSPGCSAAFVLHFSILALRGAFLQRYGYKGHPKHCM